jgi:hypothetical protein
MIFRARVWSLKETRAIDAPCCALFHCNLAVPVSRAAKNDQCPELSGTDSKYLLRRRVVCSIAPTEAEQTAEPTCPVGALIKT